jgi:hypothetical protein
MKKGSFSIGSGILVVFIVLTAVSGYITWRLFPVPFGAFFETFLAITIAGLVACLATLAVIALRSSRFWLKALGFIPVLLALAIASVAIILKIDYRLLPNMSYRHGLTAEEWKEDVRYFAEKFPERHVRLFEMVDRNEFEYRAAKLEGEVPDLDENTIKMELYKLVALPNDAHSFPNVFTHKLDWHALPFKLWLFNDGVYVLDAGRKHRHLVGARLLEIEGSAVMHVYERLRPYLAAENEFGWKDRFVNCLSIVEFLHAEGIIDDPARFEMTFETSDGLKITQEIEPHHYVPVLYWSSIRPVENDVPYVVPNDRKDKWWFEYRDDSGTLYLQFNSCQRLNGDEHIDDFVIRLGEWIEENEFERMIVDIRKNDGGDAYVSRAIAGLIIGNGRVDRPGGLFVLTSRKTFSAAVMFLSLLENNTKAVVIGEPTGQSPFFCGGPQPITLPNSGLQLLASNHYNRCSLFDDGRNWIMPDLPVEYTARDYFEGRDPAMEAALGYGTPVVSAENIDPASMELYTGRYCLSEFQILTVERGEDGLEFAVDDFFEGSYRNVRSDLYAAAGHLFHTDLDGVDLYFSEGPDGKAEGVTLRWRGINNYSERSPEGYKVPMELFAEGRVEEAAAELYRKRHTYLREVPDLETRLNQMGYTLLREEEDSKAIAIFKLNVRLFPESANTYDSLGEGYMLSGRRDEAIKCYRKALELDPDSRNALEILGRLEKGETWDRRNRKWTG